jgi:superfamily I DNA/RNA helicase
MANTKEIDFDDMLWLPIVLSIPMKKRDLLVVDEAQDLNRNQQEAALRLGNRIVIIGDINQAIYGFRGADVTSIPRMTDLLGETSRGVVELPLSFTRRCPQSHVVKANELVEDFHALPEAPEGSIESVKSTEFRGDLGNIVLGSLMMCRTNAPLVSYAFQLIQEGIKAKIQGRDLGANLGALVKKLNRFTIGDLLEALSDYEDGEKSRILKEKYPSDSKLANLADKCQCIRFLCADCKDVDDVLKRIKDVFADMDNEGRPRDGVTLSSVHRAKGLEAKTTYILNPHLMPHPMAQTEWEQVQERNIMYVAWTRSLDTMIFVRNDEKD